MQRKQLNGSLPSRSVGGRGKSIRYFVKKKENLKGIFEDTSKYRADTYIKY